MPDSVFFDTNVLIYAASQNEIKAQRATALLLRGGTISVQVLNEFTSVISRKRMLDWPAIRRFLDGVRGSMRVVPLTERLHDAALLVAERYRISVYDALIVAAAIEAGCDTLYSEDMHHGLVVDGRLTITNPFRA